MVPLEASGPNAEQIRYWNETAGPKWTAFQQVLDEQLGALGRRAMDRAGVARRERVIDVGCGCGDTTIELGRRVGPQGTVLGVDVSTPMLERAATQARAAQLANVRFENTDAQTHRFSPGQCDLVFSRFGVMFFADSVTAFTNLRAALQPCARPSPPSTRRPACDWGRRPGSSRRAADGRCPPELPRDGRSPRHRRIPPSTPKNGRPPVTECSHEAHALVRPTLLARRART